MSTDAFELTTTIPAPPEQVYDAWLDPEEHSAFTGGEATCDRRVGGTFTAWDGYISGTTLELEPGRRIVQTWRTTDFADDAEDSRLEITFTADDAGGTVLRLVHSGLPKGDAARYTEGWREFYFTGMQAYFGPEDGDDDGDWGE